MSGQSSGRPAELAAAPARLLIVNADDFGLSAGVNAGIAVAHERGVVTSASLMVRWPSAKEAARYAAANPDFAVGLHVDLGEWQYVAGEWRELYRVVPPDDADAVVLEVRRQLALFRDLMGREPTHLDSHQHVHREEPVRAAVAEIAAELSVPLRHFTADIRHCGGFYGQAARGEPWPDGISREALLHLLSKLPPGITELGCHPGFDDQLPSMYARERRREVEVLCDADVLAAIDNLDIRLVSFADVRRLKGEA